MREAYQSDLRHIVDDLLDMADLVGTALEAATTSLLEGDLGLAERVIAADPHIDERQVELDSKAVELLARQAPVAGDLRLLVAALRMSSSLERMGDLCAHVALVARRSHPELAVPAQHREQIARMSELGRAALREASQVIADRDLALAAQVEKDDEELDDLMLEVSREISRGEGYTNGQVVDLTLLIRFYERIGDHAVSLVRRVGFLVTGDSLDTLNERDSDSDSAPRPRRPGAGRRPPAHRRARPTACAACAGGGSAAVAARSARDDALGPRLGSALGHHLQALQEHAGDRGPQQHLPDRLVVGGVLDRVDLRLRLPLLLGLLATLLGVLLRGLGRLDGRGVLAEHGAPAGGGSLVADDGGDDSGDRHDDLDEWIGHEVPPGSG